MSIISQALKKAEEDRNKNTGKGNRKTVPGGLFHSDGRSEERSEGTQNPHVNTPAKYSIRHGLLILFLYTLFFSSLTGAVYYYLFQQNENKDLRAYSGKEPSAPEPVELEKAIEEPVNLTSKLTAPVFLDNEIMGIDAPEENIQPPQLNGIMYTPDSAKAVLNGFVVSEGNTFEGFFIKKIFPEKILLERKGREIEIYAR